MLKAQRDSAISGLSDQHRQQLRKIVDGIKEARVSRPSNGHISARELASGQQTNLPAEVRAALEAILVRDETGPNVGEPAPTSLSSDWVRRSGYDYPTFADGDRWPWPSAATLDLLSALSRSA